MSSLLIPLTIEDPAFKFKIDLEGVTYVISFSFNERMDRWTMDISDQSGNAIRSGIKLIQGWPLNRQYPGPDMPPGMLAMIDTAGGMLDPDVTNLGDRVKLFYEESSE